MDSRYSYDDNSETWPVFLLALVSVAVVPLTVGSLWGALRGKETHADARRLTEKTIDPLVAKRRASGGKSLLTTKNVLLAGGWAVIAVLVYVIMTNEAKPSIVAFDPYELLGVEYGTPEKVVKSAYRKLSIKFHPDKIKGVSEDEAKSLEEKFVLITKAYKALTDDETRENWEKYGHPDGEQQSSHGIALPKFLVEGRSSPLLLALYVVLIGGVLPYVVGSWWSEAKKVTKRGIYADTAEHFVNKLMNHSPAKHVGLNTLMQWLAESSEYEDLLPGKTSEQIVELYNDFLGRRAGDDSLVAVSIVPTLINGFVDITANFRNTDFTDIATEALKHFVQALPENPKNELLQLPYVDAEAVKKTNIVRLGKLTTLPRDKIKETLGINDDSQLEEALRVAMGIPKLDLISAKFEVPGETVVTPLSTAVLTLKVAVKSAKHHTKPHIAPEKLLEEQSLEALREPFKIVHDQPALPPAHAPYFPRERQSGYIGYVILQKDAKVCDQPVLFKNLDISNLSLSEAEYKDGNKTVVGTLKFPMAQPTPKEIGKYQFRVVVKSLDYFTHDLDTTVIMHVQDPPKIEEVNYDIPDPEEDSIAGAMAQLRGEKVAGDSDDDEDESDLEEEDFTDINTDTEDEAE